MQKAEDTVPSPGPVEVASPVEPDVVAPAALDDQKEAEERVDPVEVEEETLVVAVPDAFDQKLVPVACFVAPVAIGWGSIGEGPRWLEGSLCDEWMMPGTPAVWSSGVAFAIDAKQPLAASNMPAGDSTFALIGAGAEAMRARVFTTQRVLEDGSLASLLVGNPPVGGPKRRPATDEERGQVGRIIKSGAYEGQALDNTIDPAVAADLNGDGVVDALFLGSGIEESGHGHQADGGVYWADGRAPGRVVKLSTALSTATLVALTDLDRDGRLEVIIHHSTPTGRSVVMAGLTADGWTSLGVGAIDFEEYVGVGVEPLPVPLPAVAPRDNEGPQVARDGATALVALGIGQGALDLAPGVARAEVLAKLGPPTARGDGNDAWLDGGLVVTWREGQLAAVRLTEVGARVLALRGASLRGIDAALGLNAKEAGKLLGTAWPAAAKRPGLNGWDVVPEGGAQGVSLVVECPGEGACESVQVGWWTPRTMTPRAMFFGVQVGGEEAAVVKALGEPTSREGEVLGWAQGALRVKVDKGRVVGLEAKTAALEALAGSKKSAGPLVVLGGDAAKAARVLGQPDETGERMRWRVPGPGVAAYTFELRCVADVCGDVSVLAPGANL